MTESEFLARELRKFLGSTAREWMVKGEKYYTNEHDVLTKKRTAIGKDGEKVVIPHLPNNKNIDNQYAKCVDQKMNYSFSNPFTIETEDDEYKELLEDIFDNRFRLKLNKTAEGALNGGIAYLFPTISEQGDFTVKTFESYEVIPFWKDKAHTELEAFLYYYELEGYDGYTQKIYKKAEYYHSGGVKFFDVTESGALIPDVTKEDTTHIVYGEEGYNWARIPLVAFKFNPREIPLIKRVKNLQDGLNLIVSNFADNMQEDARNTILVVHNYDGENLGEFRYNLAAIGAVKVNSRDGSKGGVDKLTVEVNSENYKAIIEIYRKAIIENARGLDTKDINSSGTPNEMNIRSMYSDIDLDANKMELEFKASFEDLLWFIDMYLANVGKGDYEDTKVEIEFVRDIMVNQSQTVTDLRASVGMLSNKTIVEKNPYATKDELTRLENESINLSDDPLQRE